jgi:hypothetical protein
MKYLCLGYREREAWDAMSEAERAALREQSAAYDDVLRSSGHYVETVAIDSAQVATTLGFDSGELAVTTAPPTETTAQLEGMMILQARDLNHAIQLISRLPCMRPGGRVEIRKIKEGDSR